MVFVFEQTQPGFTAIHFQSGEHGQSIYHPAAVVRIRMNEQGGRGTAVSIFQGRMPPEFISVGTGVGGMAGNGKGDTNIRGMLY